jgi:uncharacterized protein (TIGR03435 family)
VIASTGLIASLSRPGFSQSPVPPAFEVASIRPNANGFSAPLDIGPKRFGAMGMSLNVLIQWAYDVRDFQVTGGPDWLNSARYDVQATTEEAVSQSRMRLMLQSLLADRCRLQLHRDNREFSGYDLTVAKNGPKLQPLNETSARGGIQIRSGVLSGRGAPMATLAGALTILVERPVLDKTALDGKYNFKLEYDPSSVVNREAPRENPPTAAPSPGASIFTALQEQLGLRLESRKGPLEILVIDRLETPSEN